MRLYNKHKHRKRGAMLVAAKHQHPKPAQSRAHLSTARSFLQMHWAAKRQNPRAVLCCSPAMQPAMGLPGSRAAPPASPALAHSAWPERGVSRGLGLAPQTARAMHNAVTHPRIIQSWLQCSAESFAKTTDMTWANPGPMSSRTTFCAI